MIHLYPILTPSSHDIVEPNTNKQGGTPYGETVTSVGLDYYKINWCVANMKRWVPHQMKHTTTFKQQKISVSNCWDWRLSAQEWTIHGMEKEWCHFFLILFVGVDGAKMHSR